MSDLKRIDMHTAKMQLEAKEDIILLDVRTKEEFKEGHIEGALHIPLQVLAMEVEEEIPNKNQKIYLYCRSGVRTLTAGAILEDMGYTEVYDMGGILSWPYEVVK